MKRISILLALSVLVPSLCQADQSRRHVSHVNSRVLIGCAFSSPYDCTVRYSPYAFSYNSTGLIPGGLTYSPYANGPQESGLVYEGTRFTPYAFDYNHSGLVVDYCIYPVYPVSVIAVPIPYPASMSGTATPPAPTPSGRLYGRAEGPQHDRRDDPVRIIRQYLAGRGFNSVDINYLSSAEDRTVAASFILPDKHVAIRYSDSQTMTSKGLTDQQKQAWGAFVKQFEAAGGSVYSVSASGKEQIVAALDGCQALRPQGGTATEAVRFAKE